MNPVSRRAARRLVERWIYDKGSASVSKASAPPESGRSPHPFSTRCTPRLVSFTCHGIQRGRRAMTARSRPPTNGGTVIHRFTLFVRCLPGPVKPDANCASFSQPNHTPRWV